MCGNSEKTVGKPKKSINTNFEESCNEILIDRDYQLLLRSVFDDLIEL